ncbi:MULTISPECIES: glycogen synthase GlgA [Atopobiaceae]|uniref:Glycogen synthase n=1 Tax=Parafannyhessea umbonata TaxID=604330 RepID=A0A1H9PXR5_9ACTN|nr:MULTISPECIES: glycogen synthase GlgA [Atopobiaceae]SEH47220.1 starch synthase [Parafannyhessea umbonata]SER52918.1 starch synthase [Parafannyhessea umbonata]SJZ69502.1 starch synthase [Olsenella sp. KH1P3]
MAVQGRKIKVLFASAEAVPFVKTGGLGDVAGSLPRALNHEGADVSVIMPKYSIIPQEYQEQMKHVAEFYVPLAWRSVYCGIEKLTYQGVNFYFVDNEGYFKRDGVYGYFDDGERYAFFSKAICEAIQYLPELQVDVLECNDWQCAMAPVFLREFYQGSAACRNVKTIFTVHNVKFQGQFGDKVLNDILGLADNPTAAGQLYCDATSVNYMQGALLYSDAISTVSPSYASELQMPFYGEGMDGIFRRRSSSLRGILNGIDVDAWNPATDSMIEANYEPGKMKNKAKCKEALQRELGLAVDAEKPLVVMIGRLTNQKGLGLVRYAMNRLMERGVQIAVLGTGDKDQEDAFKYFDWAYGDQMCAKIAFDNALSHRMYAGGDILLMPSEFEPCGLSQMIAMRYGTLPVVRETGGLQDSVIPYNQYTGEGTGFRFANMNADEMANVLLDACEVFWTDKKAWKRIQKQAMETDFSWSRAADDYLDMYYGLHPELAR